MESGHIKSKKIVIIIIALIAIISIGGIVFFILNNDKEVSFDSNDKEYFKMYVNLFEPGEYEVHSLDAYYLEDTKTFYYNGKYTCYSSTDDTWYDVDEVSYGSIGHFENSYCLSWDSLYGYDEVDDEYKRALKEGVHKTYTQKEIQDLLDTAYKEKIQE